MNNQHEWQTAKTLADTLNVTPSAITYADRNAATVAGRRVESRDVTQADRDRLGLTAQSRRLYRLTPETSRETVDDLLADLAGCEARIEELEAELTAAWAGGGEVEPVRGAYVSISAHKEVLAARDEYIMALKHERADLEKEVAEFEQIMDGIGQITGPGYDVFAAVTRLKDERDAATSKGSISIADHREALEQKDRYIQQLRSAARDAEESHEDFVAEVEKWKAKAEREASARWRAECDRDEYAERLDAAQSSNIRAYEAGKREAFEQQLNSSIVRRAIRRALEVVR